jgi:hypothetical protein
MCIMILGFLLYYCHALSQKRQLDYELLFNEDKEI